MRNTAKGAAFRRWIGWEAVTLGSIAALVVFIGATSPRFFFAGDKQNQYLPVARDIGRRLRAGEWLPVIDPDLGRSGNYALDLQYGLFEPSHWVVAVALSYVDNLTVAALCGPLPSSDSWPPECAPCSCAGSAGGWAAAVGCRGGDVGYVLFWAAPSWIPALVSWPGCPGGGGWWRLPVPVRGGWWPRPSWPS